MKMNLKAADFSNKEELEKSLGTKLKKPLMALKNKAVDSLPFCYEVDYFGDGKGFMSIGIAKEIDKLFKTKRTKGQGTDESGKVIKIDKKKVAYGTVTVNAEGQFEFQVMGGLMKSMQAKSVIKSIGILKKTIGDNFVVTKGASAENVAEEEADDNTDEATNGKKEETPKSSSDLHVSQDWKEKKPVILANMSKMKTQLEQLKAKLA